MSEKITVSKDVAEALEYVRKLAIKYDAPDVDATIVDCHARMPDGWVEEAKPLNNVPIGTVIRALFYGYKIEGKSSPEDHIASFVDDCAHLAANSPLEGTRRFYQGAHAGALTVLKRLDVKLPEGDR